MFAPNQISPFSNPTRRAMIYINLMSQPAKIQFRNIAEGKGKVFTFPDISESTQASGEVPPILPFGTRNCQFCVGLFLPLPTKRCAYVAHINAGVRTHDSAGKAEYDRIATAAEGEEIKIVVKSRLQSLFTRQSWTADNVAISDIRLVCPGIDVGGSGKHSTGWYVVTAIKDFLGRRSELSGEQRLHGFVYDPALEELSELPENDFRQAWFKTQTWKQKVDGEVVELTAVDEEDGLDDWNAEVVRDE